MSDLEKIDAQFHELFISKLNKKIMEHNEIHDINDELFEEIGEINVPFGGLVYFLILEDEKPVLFVLNWNRMAVEERFFILDGDSYRIVDEEDEDFSKMHDKWHSCLSEIRKKH